MIDDGGDPEAVGVLAGFFYPQPEAGDEALEQLQRSVRWQLPADYLTYLRWSNGGEGFVGNRYVSFWAADEVVALNQDYEIQRWLPDFLAFGTDGGGKAYCFDYRTQTPAVFRVGLGDMDYDSAGKVADDFRALLNP